MQSLTKKIDFAIVFAVNNANPNGDPLNGNRPRTNYSGHGEVSDVCLKRKIRDRAGEAGMAIYVQPDDRRNDNARSLKERAEAVLGAKFGGPETAELANKAWFDVRAFGQLFAYKAAKAKQAAIKKSKGKKDGLSEDEVEDEVEDDNVDGISVGIRGPVTVNHAFSVEPITITSTQITKCVNGEGDGSKRSSDTMGMKHRVDRGVYVAYGCMNAVLAERTGFSDDDAAIIKGLLPRLFENDASSSRPEGSMEILKIIWWKHNSRNGQYSASKVHKTLTVAPDGSCTFKNYPDLIPEIIEGF